MIIHVHPKLEMRIQYKSLPVNEKERWAKQQLQNMFDKVAFTYFKREHTVESLRKHVLAEFLLEGITVPSDIRFRG